MHIRAGKMIDFQRSSACRFARSLLSLVTISLGCLLSGSTRGQSIEADGFAISAEGASLQKGTTSSAGGKAVRFEAFGSGSKPHGYRFAADAMNTLSAKDDIFLYIPRLACDPTAPLTVDRSTRFCAGGQGGGWKRVSIRSTREDTSALVVDVVDEFAVRGGPLANAIRYTKKGDWYEAQKAFHDAEAVPRFKLLAAGAAEVPGRAGDNFHGGPLTALLGELSLRAGQVAIIDSSVVSASGPSAVPLAAVNVVRIDQSVTEEVTPPMTYLGADVLFNRKTYECHGEQREPLLAPGPGGGVKLSSKTGGKVTLMFLFEAPADAVKQVNVFGRELDIHGGDDR